MIRIAMNIVFLVVLSIIIALNMGYTTSFNLFWRVFPNVSVVVIAFLSFILGIIYSFGYFVVNRFRKSKAERIKKTKEDLRSREKELKKEKTKGGDAAREKEPEKPGEIGPW